MELKKVKVGEIRPNNYNPNVMNDDKFKALKRGIKQGGMLQPILITKDGEIVDGYHRWKACKELGLDEIWAIEISDTAEGQKLKTLSMNKLRGQNNPTLFANLLDEISKQYNLDDIEEVTGLNESYINSVLELKGLDDVDLDFEAFEDEEKMTRYSAIFDNKSKLPRKYGEVLIRGIDALKDDYDLSICEIILVYLLIYREGLNNAN